MKHVTSTDIDGNKYQVSHSELRWRPSAYGIVVCEGKILLTEQNNKFGLPGGGIEFGETPEQAVIREIKEETGFEARSPQLVEILTDYFSYTDGDDLYHLQTLLMFYVCEFVGGQASMDGFDAAEQLVGCMPQWFDLKDLHLVNAGSTYDWREIVGKAV